MKRLVGALSLLLILLTSCSSVKPVPICNQLDSFINTVSPRKIETHHQGESDYIVALIPNIHNSAASQITSYLILESLKNRIRFSAREGITNRSMHHFYEGPMYQAGTRRVVGMIEDFIKRPIEERREQVYHWMKNSFPEGKTPGIPVKASYLFEAIYQEEVETYGVEDPAALLAAREAVRKYFSKKITRQQMKEIVLEPRNEAFVDNIEKHAKKLRWKKGDVVPFVVGKYHIPGLKRLLKNEKISYITVRRK